MKEIQYLRPRDARKQIFVPAGEPDDFVGEYRADDDNLVVIEHHPVHVHRHVHREQSVRQPADFLRRDDADAFQRGGIIPGMVVKADATVCLTAFGLRDFEPLTNGGFAHRLVRAERNEHVERLRRFADLPVKRLKQQPHGCRAGAIGNNQEYLLAAVIFGRARFLDKVADLRISKRAV